MCITMKHLSMQHNLFSEMIKSLTTRNVIANEFEPDSIDREVVDELICNAVWSAEDDLENYIYENLNK